MDADIYSITNCDCSECRAYRKIFQKMTREEKRDADYFTIVENLRKNKKKKPWWKFW